VTLFRNKFRVESTRLPHLDYTEQGVYFVTICVGDRKCLFGSVENSEVKLSVLGEFVNDCWEQIPSRHDGVRIHAYVVMPNHLHGLIELDAKNGPYFEQKPPKSASVGAIVRSFKAAVTKWARENAFLDFAWQARYYDHVVRNYNSLTQIQEYIRYNPANWLFDSSNPAVRQYYRET